MTYFKYWNETFSFVLHFFCIDHKEKKHKKQIKRKLKELEIDADEIKVFTDSLFDARATTYITDQGILLGLNFGELEDYIDVLMCLQHECNHVRQFMLDHIEVDVNVTDDECHLRISDWAFKKCLESEVITSLLKDEFNEQPEDE